MGPGVGLRKNLRCWLREGVWGKRGGRERERVDRGTLMDGNHGGAISNHYSGSGFQCTHKQGIRCTVCWDNSPHEHPGRDSGFEGERGGAGG